MICLDGLASQTFSLVFQNKVEREPKTEAWQKKQNQSRYALPILSALNDWRQRHYPRCADGCGQKCEPKLPLVAAPNAKAWDHEQQTYVYE